MKSIIFLIAILLLLSGCKSHKATLADNSLIGDSLQANENRFYNSIKTLPLAFSEISKHDFEKYKKNYRTKCTIDSGGYISGHGLTLKSECHDICLLSLTEDKSRKVMELPSSYDQGVQGMLFSPSCNRFLIYSSYDGPDYSDYYSYRAEIFAFKVNGKGLDKIVPDFDYYSKDWSIRDAVWVDDKTIAIKVHEGETDSGYRYYKTNFNN
ncbi:MAG: hypothetical protein EOO45_15805 [Flavobacterium sp.]|nr:MAG: hypothetical protein EOO45_15805 [Flavobacterium sp.]